MPRVNDLNAKGLVVWGFVSCCGILRHAPTVRVANSYLHRENKLKKKFETTKVYIFLTF